MALDTSKFLGGDGSAVNPYIIHNADAFLALFGNSHSDGAARTKHFELIADIDLTYLSTFSLKSVDFGYSVLNGNGHKITFPQVSGFRGVVSYSGEYRNLAVEFNGSTSNIGGFAYSAVYNAVLLTGFVAGFERGSIPMRLVSNHTNNVQNSLFVIGKGGTTYEGYWTTATSDPALTSYYIEGSFSLTQTASEGLVLQADQFLASSYPNLNTGDWELLDGSLPSLKIKPYNGLPVTRVAGISKLDGVPAKRRITVQDSNGGRIARTYSDELTGEFSIQTSPHKTGLTVIVDDEIGTEIQASKAYTVGQIVHHADYAGIAYVCTTAGTTGATLPETNTYPESGTITIGTAVFTAKPINKPQIFSPVRPEVILEA